MDRECIGCGLCEAICHKNAIIVDEDSGGSICKKNIAQCDNCNICNKLCPVDQLKEKEELSNNIKVFIGRSKNRNVINKSASGGMVSELLTSLFRDSKIDAAIVAHFDQHAHIYGDIIEKEEDVLKHSGSYYHTSKQLINVSKIKQYRKVAVVGLPCHIEGILNYCNLTNQKDKIITIGLFCTIGRMYKGFYKYFLRETGFDITKGCVSQYLSRYGDNKMIHIVDENNDIFETPDEKYKFTMDFFWTNTTCLQCRKLFGLSADISVGDAWHRVVEKDGIKEKKAIVAVNSECGMELINNLKGELQLEYMPDGAYELVSSQRYGTSLKQIHNHKIVNGLKRIRYFRVLNGNPVLFRLNCRLRGRLLKKLSEETEIIKSEMKNRERGK